MPEFDTCYETVCRRHEELDRVQVSNRAMEDLVLGTGIAPEKVFRIPIGVDPVRFHLRDAAARAEARRELGLPGTAFVVGSFQKDGVGWGDGLEPKLIKGPDVLLDVAGRLAREVPELHLLLTGPARGYVAAGLERLGVAHTHVLLPDLDAVARAYRAIDLCLVTSRDEGGPKAVLESMATGVPLVTTRVGQAADLVRDGENGWLCDVEDVEGLAAAAAAVARAPAAELGRFAAAARETAEACSWDALRPRWHDLFTGVRRDGGAVRRLTRAAIGLSRPARDEIAVFYGHRRLPAPGDPVEGGMVKFQRLQAVFPNRTRDFNLLYLGSSSLPADEQDVIRLARAPRSAARRQPERRRLPRLGRRADGRAERAAPRTLLQRARHVVYQSAFCKLAADRYLGEPPGELGDPAQRRRHDRLHAGARAASGGAVLLLAGDQTASYRLETALRDARAAARRAAARDRHRLRQRPAARRRARPVGTCPLHRPIRPARRAVHLPARASAAASEGERPLPERRARGAGVRACRSSTRRAAARPSSSAMRASGSARTRPGSCDVPPSPELLAAAIEHVLERLGELRAEARARARALRLRALGRAPPRSCSESWSGL